VGEETSFFFFVVVASLDAFEGNSIRPARLGAFGMGAKALAAS
jgi:hypothetical protein